MDSAVNGLSNGGSILVASNSSSERSSNGSPFNFSSQGDIMGTSGGGFSNSSMMSDLYDRSSYDPLASVSELLTESTLDHGFGSSGFVIQDGKIFGNNDNRFTYCLDLETGRQIWKEESSGSASPISYLNGVLYFMGGGDGRLHAIDANTGKHLWRLRSPDVDKNSGAFFYGTCVAVPGQGGKKGRVVATTGLNAYGYEAIR